MNRRHVNWPEKLNAAIDAVRATPFAWGSHDCCMFACSVINELIGVDPAADLRGAYRTRLGAARVLKRLGGVEGIAETRTAAHGFAALPSPAFAQRGDLVLADTAGEGPALGICVGGAVAFSALVGLTFRKVGECRKAWRVA